MFLKLSSLNSIFQDISNDVSYVGLSEFFVISTCLKNMEKYGDITECNVLGSLQNDL